MIFLKYKITVKSKEVNIEWFCDIFLKTFLVYYYFCCHYHLTNMQPSKTRIKIKFINNKLLIMLY